MHARELVEVAVIAVTHANSYLAQEFNADDHARAWSRYWTISRCRLDRWNHALPASGTKTDRSPRRICEEILTSEILTRAWTALNCVAPAASHSDQESIARNIYLAHQEARNRVLKLLAHPELLSTDDSIALNRLRRRCERWTDLLLAYLSQHGAVDEFAFDAERVRDFATDLREDGVFEGRAESWLLLLASLRNAFQQGYSTGSLNADLNKQLAAIVIRSIPAHRMHDMELPGAMWQVRLERLTSETEGLVNQLFALEALATVSSKPLRRFDDGHSLES